MAKNKKRIARLVKKAESPVHGFGCFAKQFIKKGTCIGKFTGKKTTQDTTHVLWGTKKGKTIGVIGKTAFKYLNHDDNPNTKISNFWVYALTDIPAGAELFINYGPNWQQLQNHTILRPSNFRTEPEGEKIRVLTDSSELVLTQAILNVLHFFDGKKSIKEVTETLQKDHHIDLDIRLVTALRRENVLIEA